MLYFLAALVLTGITVPACIGAKISKKIKTALVITASLVTVFAVIVFARPVYISQADASQDEAFARRLAQGYFGYERLDFFGGLSDYTIQEAALLPAEENVYVDIVYDVRPYQDIDSGNNEWAAGNGTVGDNGWMIKKSGYYSYWQIGDFYFMDFVGTGL